MSLMLRAPASRTRIGTFSPGPTWTKVWNVGLSPARVKAPNGGRSGWRSSGWNPRRATSWAARDLKALTIAFATMEQGLETERFRAADSAFHLAIAQAARNDLMRRAIEEARADMWIPIDRRIGAVFPSAHRQHEQILRAIRT